MSYKSLAPADNDVSVYCPLCKQEYRINLYLFCRRKSERCLKCDGKEDKTSNVPKVQEAISSAGGPG